MANTDIPLVQELDGVYLLDTQHMDVHGIVGVFLLPGEDGKFSLIETGPTSTLPTIKKGIAEAGFELDGLEAVLVTHIHLDHAGASGTLAQETGAKVYVHEIGAKHLVDPSRLMSSATRIYGNRMEELWGEMVPIPEAQVEALQGGETLEIGGYSIEVIYTPGHASHHVAYLLNGETMFTGDAANIYLTGSSVIRPALPPPDIDLETWRDTAEKMLSAQPKRLMLTHFGLVEDVETHLRRVPERNSAWAETILAGMLEGEESDALEERIAAFGDAELEADNVPPEVMKRHRLTSNYAMTVMGVTRYWQKHHSEKL